jgi:hypothetical protein
MARKINIKKIDPEHYAQVKSEQKKLEAQCAGELKIERLCPYCRHPVSVVIRGTHGFVMEVCPKCEEEVIFPPMAFRLAN